MAYEGFEKYVFGTYANPNDQLQIVLRGHLYIESILTEIVKKQFPYPNEFNFDRMNFDQKLQLACACGVMSKTHAPSYRKLNTYRNSFAHNVHFELTEQQINDLSSTIAPEYKPILDGFYMKNVAPTEDVPSHILKLRYTITIMYLALTIKRDKMHAIMSRFLKISKRRSIVKQD